MQSIKQLLTLENTPDGAPLFTSATQLAISVVRVGLNEFKDERATALMIGFVFRNERSCSIELRNAILAATRERLTKLSKHIQDDWVLRVGQAIDFLNADLSQTQGKRSRPDEQQFEALLRTAREAKEQFIITPVSAEKDADEVYQAKKLNELLLNVLGIHPLRDDEPKTRYKFLFPSVQRAQEFWLRLRLKVIALGVSSDQADERLNYLDTHKVSEDGNPLEVYVVPAFVCGCPIVVFNPDSRFATAYSFAYHRNNVIDAIEWDSLSIDEWQRNVYKLFKPSRNVKAAKEAGNLSFDKFSGYRVYYRELPKENNNE